MFVGFQLNNANNKIKEMKTEMKEVNEWMDEARGLIDDVSEDMTLEDIDKLKDKVEVSQYRLKIIILISPK